jgi:hypothetical protein
MKIIDITDPPIKPDIRNAYIDFFQNDALARRVVTDGAGRRSSATVNQRLPWLGQLIERCPRVLRPGLDPADKTGDNSDPHKIYRCPESRAATASARWQPARWTCGDLGRTAKTPGCRVSRWRSATARRGQLKVAVCWRLLPSGKGIQGLLDEMRSYLDAILVKMKIGGAPLAE